MTKATRRCGTCGRSLVEITFDRDGTQVVMRSCSRCETRSWHADGRAVPFHEVAEAVFQRK